MREWPSLIGQKFGMLTVIGQAPSTAKGQRRWICKCDCGTEKIVMGSNLKRGTTVSCGCKHKNDLTGQKIGKLTVLERSDNISGFHGVYFDRRTGKYRARLKFRGKLYNLGSFTNPEDAVKARKRGEEEIFGKFLDDLDNGE